MKKLTAALIKVRSPKAFALPTVVITATILMIAGVSVAQAVVSVSGSLRGQSYNELADEAARAAVSYASSCLKKNGTSYWTSPLTPGTDCSGSSTGGSLYLVDQAASGDSPHYRATFTVSTPNSDSRATAEGKVELLNSSSSVTRTWVSDKIVVVNVAGGGKTVTDINATYQTCALADSAAYCWGNGGYGRLGNGSTSNSSVPVAVDTSGVLSGKTVTAVTMGNYHGCAIADGKAYCWGRNSYGQLGNNSTSDSSVPVAVDTSGVLSGKTVTAISAKGNTTCAIASGQAYCWGRDNAGTLGTNYGGNSSVPVAVDTSGVLSGKTVTDISAGDNHACVIANGNAYCWGSGSLGRLGSGSTANSGVPVAVDTSGVLSGKTVTDISAASSPTCAVANGQAYCWGVNNYGQLGNNSTSNSSVPVAVDTSGVLSGKTVTDISANTFHVCTVANGSAYCWGYNNSGELGNNTTTQSLVPVAVNTSGVLSGKTVTDITSGNNHSCAIADRSAYCWGTGSSGALGNGSTTSSSIPVAVSSLGG